MSGPVLLVCATAFEWSALRSLTGLHNLPPVGVPLRIHAGLWALRSGVGPRRAARVEGPLAAVRPGRVVHFGFAGALDPELPVGTLLLLSARSNTVQRGGEPPPSMLETDAASRRWLRGELAGPAPLEAPCLTVDRFISDPAERRALVGPGYRLVEMESAVVAAACATVGCGYVGLRAISDDAIQPLPPLGRRGLRGWLRGLGPRPVGALVKGAVQARAALEGALTGLESLPAEA